MNGVDRAEAFGLNFFAHMSWIAGSVGGALFGSVIGNVTSLGLDFALPAMFIALLLPHFSVPSHLLAAFFGGALSLILFLAGVGQWSVILATVCAATLTSFRSRPAAEARPSGKNSEERERFHDRASAR